MPNGVVTENTFDALNRLKTRTCTKDAVTIYAAAYGYDLVGNRLTIDETSRDAGGATTTERYLSYVYDHMYRLAAEAEYSDAARTAETELRAYSYDLAGNRLALSHSIGGGPAEITDYVCNDLNELETIAVGGVTTTYMYDLNGNRTAKEVGGVTTAYEYDCIDRLMAVDVGDDGSKEFSATYDYRTRRLTKTEGADTTAFRYDGGVSFHEIRNGSLTVEFVRGSGMGGGIGSILYSDRDPQGTHSYEFFGYNAVGHTVAITEDSGEVTKSELFEAFGNERSSTGSSANNRRANTKERDTSTGLDYHGMRYYDPAIGRYLARDPVGYADGLNVYLYVHGNPVNFIDPLGLLTPKETAGIVGGYLKRGAELVLRYAREMHSPDLVRNVRRSAKLVGSLSGDPKGTAGRLVREHAPGISLYRKVHHATEAVYDIHYSQEEESWSESVEAGEKVRDSVVSAEGHAAIIWLGAKAIRNKYGAKPPTPRKQPPPIPKEGGAPKKPTFPKTAQEMDDLLGMKGTRVPDAPPGTPGAPHGTPGRGKVTWQPSDKVKMTLEQHPYHTKAPAFHKGRHYHVEGPWTEGSKHGQRFTPGDPIPGM